MAHTPAVAVYGAIAMKKNEECNYEGGYFLSGIHQDA